MAIVLVFVVGVALLGVSGAADVAVAVALGGAGVAVAVVGFIDDHRHVGARWRLVGHFGAAAWALAWLQGLPPLDFLGVPVDLRWAGDVLAAVYLVWLLNLYNFMDGIDGIAGLEAVTVGLGATVLYLWHLPPGLEWTLPALLALAALGFLVWNWPPARIFMGDAGSGFLGLMLGVLSIQAARLGTELWWSWLILLGVFFADTTMTLLRRLWRGEKVYEAHRSHAYQVAACRLGGHQPVILVIGAINLLWLLPLAFAVAAGWLDGVVAVVVAYAPLLWLAGRFKA